MTPSLCEICGSLYCDHAAEERGLTPEQWEIAMNRPLMPEELRALESNNPQRKVQAGRRASKEIFGYDHPLPPVGSKS